MSYSCIHSKTVFRYCPTRVSHTSVNCCPSVPRKNVLQDVLLECHASLAKQSLKFPTVFYRRRVKVSWPFPNRSPKRQIVLQECPARASRKGVMQVSYHGNVTGQCPIRVFHKSASQESSPTLHKGAPQGCPTGAAFKSITKEWCHSSVPQECRTVPRLPKLRSKKTCLISAFDVFSCLWFGSYPL